MIKSCFSESILKRLFSCGVIACVTIENPLHAVPAARALLAGGIDIIELTLRTPKSIESLHRITTEVPEILTGVGTILTPQQVEESIAAGGHFGVAPGISERVVKTAQDKGFPFAPGIATPSELEHGLELGCREMKFFPAEPSGGVSFMKSIYAPYAHLGVQFLPLGGINIRNMSDYFQEKATLAVGGSWLVTPDLLRTENWSAITVSARAASALVKEIRHDTV
ncbi:MAG: bifunctional 4-hydroxy-2-oxoglutarate aldolase/2-dehydro-3-deoxy-phosphogluconate aldolase [Planctomycetaceae bacterium]|jgi:2-dehydro-3-deoxyphosphogluconate aldolase/(4S)-4-hydroxy-2-oxoglutarate aldolase|nr:bifunctional 4-hydroxy-2-oxoglutarate aldolase/2-dehydro-3-deoxy-phosphogluconate aldolase [Planctomycetaceae bacterium]